MRRFLSVFTLLLLSTAFIQAQKTNDKQPKAKPQTITLGDGNVQLVAPAEWKKKTPRSRILAYEFSIPSGKDDVNDGRFTVSTMGGSIKANVERWEKQFPKKTKHKVREKKISDQVVHMIDLSGTFLDSRGPAFPAVEREDYRLLAAIIPTEKSGQHFLKFYGPAKVVAKNEKAFSKMIESLKLDSPAAKKPE